MRRLSTPPTGRSAVQAWVRQELTGLFDPHAGDPVLTEAAEPMPGGQPAADRALANFDVTGYARRRNEVWPDHRQGASRLSPYIRHGLLSLPRVWADVAGGPADDVAKFRDELCWQEYARHVYARIGSDLARSGRYRVTERTGPGDAHPWMGDARCVDDAWRRLRSEGWITNQERMWLASHWSVRGQRAWSEGETAFFRLLLDGSRAANRLGWQWTVGTWTGKPYGFSREQVRRRAPGLCDTCSLQSACPIEEWPVVAEPRAVESANPALRRDPDPSRSAGPARAVTTGSPVMVWITAESLGDADPALTAHPDLPVTFVFDEGLLPSLRLAEHRLVFLAECLADLATHRELAVWRGRPTQVLAGMPLAATFTPVPGWRSRAAHLDVVSLHPWPWLRRPAGESVTSFTAWSRA